jgi:undecaprenyl pyrophosphate synthase
MARYPSLRRAINRVPNHIAVIPDGNRQWAAMKGLSEALGYEAGVGPGLHLFNHCKQTGVKELTFCGYTQDNTRRPRAQAMAFQKACVDAVEMKTKEDADLLVLGNTHSPMFPNQLLPYTRHHTRRARRRCRQTSSSGQTSTSTGPPHCSSGLPPGDGRPSASSRPDPYSERLASCRGHSL